MVKKNEKNHLQQIHVNQGNFSDKTSRKKCPGNKHKKHLSKRFIWNLRVPICQRQPPPLPHPKKKEAFLRSATTMIPQRASYVFILKPSFKWAATGHSLPCRVSNLAGSFLTNLKFCLSTTGIPTILGFWEDGYHGITRPKNRYPQTWCLVSLKKVSPAANMEIWRHFGVIC